MILILPSIISGKDNFFVFREQRHHWTTSSSLLPSTPLFFSSYILALFLSFLSIL